MKSSPAVLGFAIALSVLAACGGGPRPQPDPEPQAPSCATLTCPGNQSCVDTDEGPTCACTVMAMCVQGHTWDDERCECVPTTTAAGACTADTDCRREDNYCGGCHCLALGPGESAPTCDEPVQCFAQPCATTQGEPACVDGRCVLR